MDEQALERAKRRIAEGRAGRADLARFEAALDRSREQIEELARAAEELESGLPDRIGDAVRDGFHREVAPVGRTLAELRGLLNQANRRLERLEQELLAERHARVDDLALLVDLVSSGWQGVDERLRRVEESTAQVKVVRQLETTAA
jgi:ABC-type transporter Mla subunit MlaD